MLLVAALFAAAAVTAYLVRSGVPTAAPSAPQTAPFGLLSLRDGQVWARNPDGTGRRVSRLAPAFAARVRTAALSPDGRHLALITVDGAGERAWLLRDLAADPEPIPGPATPGAATGRYRALSWEGSAALGLLLETGPDGHGAVWAGRWSLPRREAVWRQLAAGARALSLSPADGQVALVATRPGGSAFAAQSVVLLQRPGEVRGTIAYRCLGACAAGTVAWSPDGGTVAIQTPGQGLEIRKSSGRAVLQVGDGRLPVAFSDARTALLAYLAGSRGAWTLHVLALHGELDRALPVPAATPPRWLGWSPDARALLYLTDEARPALWQIAADTGSARRLPWEAPGEPLAAVPPGALRPE